MSDEMKCPNCATPIPSGMLVCESCGQEMTDLFAVGVIEDALPPTQTLPVAVATPAPPVVAPALELAEREVTEVVRRGTINTSMLEQRRAESAARRAQEAKQANRRTRMLLVVALLAVASVVVVWKMRSAAHVAPVNTPEAAPVARGESGIVMPSGAQDVDAEIEQMMAQSKSDGSAELEAMERVLERDGVPPAETREAATTLAANGRCAQALPAVKRGETTVSGAVFSMRYEAACTGDAQAALAKAERLLANPALPAKLRPHVVSAQVELALEQDDGARLREACASAQTETDRARCQLATGETLTIDVAGEAPVAQGLRLVRSLARPKPDRAALAKLPPTDSVRAMVLAVLALRKPKGDPVAAARGALLDRPAVGVAHAGFLELRAIAALAKARRAQAEAIADVLAGRAPTIQDPTLVAVHHFRRGEPFAVPKLTKSVVVRFLAGAAQVARGDKKGAKLLKPLVKDREIAPAVRRVLADATR